MSKIMQAMFRASQDSRKPLEERKRYSCWHDDPGYANFDAAVAQSKRLVVRIDGVTVEECAVADEILGIVVFYEMPYRVVGDRIVTIERRGVVCVDLVCST